MEEEDEQAAKTTKEVSALKLAAQFNLHSRSKAPPITRVQFQRETKKGPSLSVNTSAQNEATRYSQGQEQSDSSDSSEEDDLGPSTTMIAAARRRRKDRLEGSMKSTFYRSAVEKDLETNQREPEKGPRAGLEEMKEEAERYQVAKKRRIQAVRTIESEVEKREESQRERSADLDGPAFIASSRKQYFEKFAKR